MICFIFLLWFLFYFYFIYIFIHLFIVLMEEQEPSTFENGQVHELRKLLVTMKYSLVV